MLAERFGTVLAVDLSLEMLRLAPADRASGCRPTRRCLPVPDGSADAVVLINAFLFPAEVDRVLAPDGVVVWVNSSGEETPIHLPADEVEHVLPGDWDGVASRAGARHLVRPAASRTIAGMTAVLMPGGPVADAVFADLVPRIEKLRADRARARAGDGARRRRRRQRPLRRA